VKEEKAAVRRRMAALRSALSAQERSVQSGKIAENVLSWETYLAAEVVFVYASMGAEVETWGLMERMLADGKKLCLPRMGGKGRMSALTYAEGDELERSAYGAMEPLADAEVVHPQSIGLVLVPALAVTRAGERIGYGGGCYDRYLPLTQACRAALCFSQQIVDRLPVDMYDGSMNVLVAPEGVIRCGRSIQ